MDLLTELREHRAMVVNLAWRGLYEYAAYLHALNNFRVLIGTVAAAYDRTTRSTSARKSSP